MYTCTLYLTFTSLQYKLLNYVSTLHYIYPHRLRSKEEEIKTILPEALEIVYKRTLFYYKSAAIVVA